MIDFGTAKLTQIDPQALVGKTIAEVDNSACNVLLIEFSDGMSIAVQSHHDHTGLDRYEVTRMDEQPSEVVDAEAALDVEIEEVLSPLMRKES